MSKSLKKQVRNQVINMSRDEVWNNVDSEVGNKLNIFFAKLIPNLIPDIINFMF